MKRIVITLAMAASLAMGVAMPTSGEAREGQRYSKMKKKTQHHRRARTDHEHNSTRSDYYEHLADKLPVGSSRWFEQMEREGRFGGRERCC